MHCLKYSRCKPAVPVAPYICVGCASTIIALHFFARSALISARTGAATAAMPATSTMILVKVLMGSSLGLSHHKNNTRLAFWFRRFLIANVAYGSLTHKLSRAQNPPPSALVQ